MNRTQIYLPQKHINLLRKQAVKQGTTVSHIIRMALRERLEGARDATKGRPSETLLHFARRIEKTGARGPRDLASHADKYLYGGKR